MVQELGETVEAMMRQDDEDVQKILNERPAGHYWIVIHHRRTQMKLASGEQVFMRHIKAYDKKPSPLIGTIILEIKDGERINVLVSPHDAPLDWEKIEKTSGLMTTPGIFEKHPISNSYIYNN